jgi:polyisoprenoid-binding protein YceI
MKKINTIISSLFVLLLFCTEANAQSTYTLSSNPDLKVEGTSTIHDWHMTSTTATGKASMTQGPNGASAITSLSITLPVESLKSGKGQMDTNAYKALKTNKYPDIRFELMEVVSINGSTINAKGKLTISGSSKVVSLDVKQKLVGNTIEFSGTLPIKFSEFNVEPPTAIFGTIKTGDALQLSFTVVFK